MRDHELPELLRRAGDDLPEPDVAESTWAQGRVARRRRWASRALGGLAAAGAVGVLALQLTAGSGPGSGSLPVTPAGSSGDGATQQLLQPPLADLEVEAVSTAEDPGGQGDDEAGMRVVAGQPDPVLLGAALEARSLEVWTSVYTGCLASRGYTAERSGAALSVTLEGAFAGDYERDVAACRAELVTDAPAAVAPGTGVGMAQRGPLTGRYFQYYWAQRCLQDSGLPTGALMPAEDFILGLAWSQLPPWHPYQEAAEQGLYEQARTACPIVP